MPSTWRGVSYVEYTDREMPFASPIESFANDASSAERIWDQIDWLSRGRAKQTILGYPLIKPTGLSSPGLPVAYINRNTPLTHPYYLSLTGGKPFMYCTKINRIEGWSKQEWIAAQSSLKDTSSGDGNDLPLHQYARMNLGFESLTYEILEDSDPAIQTTQMGFSYPDESSCTRYVTKLPGTSTDYVSLGNNVMFFAAGPMAGPDSAINFTVGKIIVTSDLRYRWELVPQKAVASLAVNPDLDPTLAAIDNALGKVNDSLFPTTSTGSGGYAAGTLLLLGVMLTPIRSAIGDRLWTVEFHFKFLPTGHHKQYSIAAPGPLRINGFVEISSDGVPHVINPTTPAGVHVYDVAPFDPLFWPPTTS